MKLAKALNEKEMDVRLIDRLLAQGKITKEEIDKYITTLPDEEGNYEKVEDKTALATSTETTEQ